MESESDKSSDGDFVGGEVVSEDDFEASCDDSLAPSRAGVVLQKAVSDWTILVAKHVSDCSGLHGPCEFRLFDSSEYHAPSFVLEFICLGCQEEFLFRGDDGTVKDRFLASFLDCGTGSNAMGPKVTKQSWDSIFDTHPNFETITHTTDGDDSGLHKGLDVVMNHTFFGIHDGCDDKCRFNMFPKLQALWMILLKLKGFVFCFIVSSTNSCRIIQL